MTMPSSKEKVLAFYPTYLPAAQPSTPEAAAAPEPEAYPGMSLQATRKMKYNAKLFAEREAVAKRLYELDRLIVDNPYDSRTEWPDTELAYAIRLATAMRDKFWPDVPQWKPLDDLRGVLTQIDNMTCGLMRTPSRAPEPIMPEAERLLLPEQIHAARELFYENSAGCNPRKEVIDRLAAILQYPSSVPPEKAESADPRDEVIRELVDALNGVIPYMEEAEKERLVGHEGCHWPVEIVRAALARAEKYRKVKEQSNG